MSASHIFLIRKDTEIFFYFHFKETDGTIRVLITLTTRTTPTFLLFHRKRPILRVLPDTTHGIQFHLRGHHITWENYLSNLDHGSQRAERWNKYLAYKRRWIFFFFNLNPRSRAYIFTLYKTPILLSLISFSRKLIYFYSRTSLYCRWSSIVNRHIVFPVSRTRSCTLSTWIFFIRILSLSISLSLAKRQSPDRWHMRTHVKKPQYCVQCVFSSKCIASPLNISTYVCLHLKTAARIGKVILAW